jgi:S-DNA-T family DNA segregation ATPase FtsK/SpoIIIE
MKANNSSMMIERILDKMAFILRLLLDVASQVSRTVRFERLNHVWLGYLVCVATWIVCLRWEFKIHLLNDLEPTVYSNPKLALTWILIGSSLPAILYVLYLTTRRATLARRLDPILRDAKLVNFFDQTPMLRTIRSNDDGSSVIEFDRRGIPFDRFVSAKSHLSTALRSHVQDIRDQVTRTSVRITYSKLDIPNSIDWRHCQPCAPGQIVIGRGRKELLSIKLASAPHILVAGQTGGGKSTFLRQMICGQYLGDRELEIVLVDLKEGLEFQLFENLPRIQITATARETVDTLTRVEDQLTKRLQLLKKEKLRDFVELRQRITAGKLQDQLGTPGRILLVIDEFAELTSTGGLLNLAEIQSCRRIVNRISRLGRAAGIHLVVATQRPDSSVLDTQIRANLPVKLCFQMSDMHSSMVVLGNASAFELPSVAGRAVVQRGFSNTEVQTPFLGSDEAEKLLSGLKEESVGSTMTAVKSEIQSDGVKSHTPTGPQSQTQRDQEVL